MFKTLTRLALGAAFLSLAPLPVRAQDAPAPNPVREKYTKHEFKVKMRDGAFLFTSIYAPKDTARTYPVMMQRTPYSVSPYGIDNYQSSWFPLVDRNPQKFMDIDKATDADFIKATHKVHRGSAVTLNVVP